VISTSQKTLLDAAQQSQETNNHAFGGIRTRILRERAVADSRLRPRGHSDEH